ncbi:Hpt domain-containing protein [Candidatus Magnetomoraceae bacterium gMMP-1]
MEQKTQVTVKVNEKMKKFIPQFLNNTHADFEKLKTAVESNDFKAVHTIAHSMKGYGTPFGFIALSDISAIIQVQAIQNNIEEVKRLTDELSNYLDNINIEYVS